MLEYNTAKSQKYGMPYERMFGSMRSLLSFIEAIAVARGVDVTTTIVDLEIDMEAVITNLFGE